MKRALVAVAVVVLAVGCGEGSDEATPPADASAGRVYLLRDGKVWPALREVPETGDDANEIAAELLRGPSDDELELGFTTALTDDLELPEIRVADGVARVELDPESSPEGIAQLVSRSHNFRLCGRWTWTEAHTLSPDSTAQTSRT